MERSVGVVIPAYKPNIDILRAYVTAIETALHPTEIRIELDGIDPDRSTPLDDLSVTINTVPGRRGKGAAITHGFDHLDTSVLAFVDADGSTPTQSVRAITESVIHGPADLAIGSRHHPDASIRGHQTRIRGWLGQIFALIARNVLDVKVHDYQCGAKAITQTAWQSVRQYLYASGFAWDIELIAMTGALGYRVEEIPIEWEDRAGSTVPPIQTSIDLARTLIATRHRTKVLENHRFHTLIETYRSPHPKLIDRTHGER